MVYRTLALCAVAFACTVARAADAPSTQPTAGDWQHWLGPRFDGTSDEKGLLRKWPRGGPDVIWRAKIKQGWACPVVSGNDVFVAMTEFDDKHWNATREMMVCLDADTGQQRWEYSYPASYNFNQVGWATGGVRATPTVTDKHVYHVSPQGNIRCLDRASGKVVWEKSLAPDYYFKKNFEQKGYSCSPLVHGRVLVLHSGGTPTAYNYTLALDALTGEKLWSHEEKDIREKSMPGGHGQSPILADFNGEPCAVLFYNRYLRAFRLSDGKEVFKFDAIVPHGRQTSAISPLIVGDKIILVPHNAHAVCIEVDRNDPRLPARKLWTSPDFFYTSYHNFVPSGDHLYGFNCDGNDKTNSKNVFNCYDIRTGKIVWQKDGFVSGCSLMAADGLLFVRSLQTLSLVEATPEGFRETGRMENIHGFGNWGVTDARGLTDVVIPVLSRGRLYVRCPEELLCLRVCGGDQATKPAAARESAAR